MKNMGKSSENKSKITKEQAMILLEQAKMETEKNLKTSQARGKRILTLGVILLIVAVVIGVGSWMILRAIK